MNISTTVLIFALGAVGLGIAYAVWAARWVQSRPEGEAAQQTPCPAIREGAGAFIPVWGHARPRRGSLPDPLGALRGRPILP